MDAEKAAARPPSLWVLAALLTLIGIGALASGAMLFLVPDGHLFSWTVAMLDGTPFRNFTIPGIILFVFVGVLPVLTVYGLLKRPDWRWAEALNPSKSYHWSMALSWAVGVMMLIWITVETLLLGYMSFLQPMVAVWGALIIALTLLTGVRRYCRNE